MGVQGVLAAERDVELSGAQAQAGFSVGGRIMQSIFMPTMAIAFAIGPMAGQNHHFRLYAKDKIPYAIDRYVNETHRLYRVLDKRLGDREFVAGDYSIADMAIYPWIRPYENQGQDIDEFASLKRWFTAISERPAVERAYALADEIRQQSQPVDEQESHRILFGQR